MNNNNAIERIVNIISLLATTNNPANEEKGLPHCYDHLFSASMIANALKLPTSQIIADLQALFSYKKLRESMIVFSTQKNRIVYDGYFTEEKYDTDDGIDAEKLKKFFCTLDWKKDLFGWICDENILDNLHPIVLTDMQNTLFEAAFPDFCSSEQLEQSFTITDNNNIPTDIQRIQRGIEQVIRHNLANKKKRLLVFNYKPNKQDDYQKIEIFPRKISYNTENNRVYCISDSENQLSFYRLDAMERGSIHTKPIFDSSAYNDCDSKLLEHIDYVWAMDHSGTTPIHVKLQIKAHTKNIIAKIDGDTSRRKYRRFYQDSNSPEYWYYEDDVIGLDAFRRWVRQYGSSIKVLEPKELSEQLIQNAKDILKNYGISEE